MSTATPHNDTAAGTQDSLEDTAAPIVDQTNPENSNPAGDSSGDTAAADTQVEAWREHLRRVGIEEAADVNVGVETLATAYRQRDEQLAEMVEYNRLLQEQLRHAPQGQSPSAAPQVQQPAATSPFDLPALPSGWERFRVRVGEDVSWADDTPPSVRQAAEDHWAHVRDYQYRISTPAGLKEILDSYIEQAVLPRVTEQLGSRESQLTEQQLADRFVEQNATWFYDRDALTGRPIVDPRTGSQRLSGVGQEFADTMADLARRGIGSFADRLELAQKLVPVPQSAPSSQPVTPTVANPLQQRQAVQETIDQQRAKLNGRRAAPSGNRVPQAQPAPAVPDRQKRQASYGQSLVESLRKNGVELS